MKPEDVLSQAAEAAEKLLPGLIEKRNELNGKLSDLAQEIRGLEAIIFASKNSKNINKTEKVELAPSGRAARGEIEDRIDSVLGGLEKLSMEDIRSKIKAQFGVEYGASSIYANLTKGVKSGKYNNSNGKWSFLK